MTTQVNKKSNTEILGVFVKRYFGKDFKFRENQEDVIIDILDFYDTNPEGIYLLDAPTGSGKSVISMCVSGALELKFKDGYILASDLALQNQYEKDFAKNKLPWGSIKGLDNYYCDVNSEKYRFGDCKLKNMSANAVKQLPCYSTCGYISNRIKAIGSNVSLLNYSYWLIQRNYVAPAVTEGTEPFEKRDFIICDEAHKATEIVQNHFSPTLTDKSRPMLEELRKFYKDKYNLLVEVSEDNLKECIRSLHTETDKEALFQNLGEVTRCLHSFLKVGNRVKEIIAGENKGRPTPRSLVKFIRMIDRVKDMHCKFEDYCDIIDNTSHTSIIKNTSDKQVVFNCTDDSFLMKKYFHNQSGFSLFMTATMGDHLDFYTNIGGDEKMKYTRMPSSFTFDRSPIYVYSKKKMSFAHKEKTLPWLLDSVSKILSKHSSERGIIHTGSYDISRRIFESLSPNEKRRVFMYRDSEEKKLILTEFEESDNGVLIGPSLLEGIDLKDDLSRFQIFAKVPYPSLMDEYVKAKMKLDKGWYNWKTIIGVLQGMGRSIRSDNDWAVTYFLDGCVLDLVSKSRRSFPHEFISRLKIIK